jgi:hypothetical protein
MIMLFDGCVCCACVWCDCIVPRLQLIGLQGTTATMNGMVREGSGMLSRSKKQSRAAAVVEETEGILHSSVALPPCSSFFISTTSSCIRKATVSPTPLYTKHLHLHFLHHTCHEKTKALKSKHSQQQLRQYSSPSPRSVKFKPTPRQAHAPSPPHTTTTTTTRRRSNGLASENSHLKRPMHFPRAALRCCNSHQQGKASVDG